MRNYLKILKIMIFVVAISGAALWGVQQVRFFDKLPAVFSQPAFAEGVSRGEGAGPGNGFRGGRGQELSASNQAELPVNQGQERGGQGQGLGLGRGPGGHAKTASLAGWINVGAYLSIFAFGVMLAYYAELGVRTLTKRREACDAA